MPANIPRPVEERGATTRGASAWTFAGRGLLRGMLGLGAVIGAVLAVDVLERQTIVGIFAATAVVMVALHVGGMLRTAGAEGRLPLLTALSTAPGRWFQVVGAVCLLAGVVLTLLPVLPGDSAQEWVHVNGGPSSLYLTAAVLLLLALLVSAWLGRLALVIPIARRAVSRSGPTAWERTEAGVLLSVVLTTAFSLVAALLNSPVVTEVDEFGTPIRPGAPTSSLASASDNLLLAGLAPYLQMTTEDLRPPQRVDSYLAESNVWDLSGRLVASKPSLGDVPETCPEDMQSPCLVVVNENCPESRACEPFELSGEVVPVGVDDRVVAYGRVLRRDAEDSPDWTLSPYGDRLTMLLQYWLFVPYDDYQSPLALGMSRLVKRHAADWEAIVIGLSDTKPLFVAATGHCGGSWRPWQDVSVEGDTMRGKDPLGTRMHPAVGYTQGSHALYFDALSGRGPDWLGCENVKRAGLLRLASYAANVRDVTGDDFRVLLTPLAPDESERVLRLPAYWGVHNEIKLVTPIGDAGEVKGTVRDPAGPPAPSTKPLYREPVRTIFCSRTWQRDGARTSRPDGCTRS